MKNNIVRWSRFFILTFMVIFVFGCSGNEPKIDKTKVIQLPKMETQPESQPSLPPESKKVQSVILMIGDGMGVGQVSQAVMYRQTRNPLASKLNLEKLLDSKNMGLATTYTYGDLVTDSACGATAMACGIKTLSEMVGLDPQGFPCETILEKAAKLGKATGLVSNTRLSHATPAAFAAHQVSRHLENEIAEDHIEKHNVDIFLDGGARHLIPQYKDEATKEPMKVSDLAECSGIASELDGKSKREDQKNLVEVAKAKGYQFVCTADQLNALPLEANTKVLGVFASSTFPMIQERNLITSLPPLSLMTEKALELLDKKPGGFFLMVEGGLIDYAGHDNDPGTLLQETLDFDKAIGVARDYVEKHPETLLIVTADHETGGFGISYRKDAKKETTLPSGLIHHQTFNFGPHTQMDLLMKQSRSFREIIDPILEKLYPKEGKGIALKEAAKELIAFLNEHTAYVLTEEEASKVLFRKPGAKDYEPADFADFYYYESLHWDALGRAVASQTNMVWATGTHTATPVLVFAMGPEKYASLVRGMIDNTDIPKILEAAFLGSDFQPEKVKIQGSLPETLPELKPTEVPH